MTASNESLNYVSYPTVVLAKSSKLIPTMIMGTFIERKSYSFVEWLGASLISAGIIIFNFSRISSSSSSSSSSSHDDQQNSMYGLFLLVFSLSMDGLLNSCQGLLKRTEWHGGSSSSNNSSSNNSSSRKHQYRIPTAMETMLFTNLYATVFLCPVCVYSGQFSKGITLITTTKQEGSNIDGLSAVQIITILNACAAAGQVFIFFTIHYFSPLICTTITTTRKFFTILLSVRNFGHVFNFAQWSSIFMVFGGLYFEIVSKNFGTKSKMKNI
uniref:Sugar phosphate transporter domain-containing protein n=2 Tax=Ditylum brightwellii TaxID=49249 RepID=A0A6V2EIX2_9STRA|mmetsp:Transcript_4219/g.5662  ORF Transcript_4219/g.5662 Transcript_4219/m.5662 type:complete len:270 (+) Transcript_4219:205-1014(+)